MGPNDTYIHYNSLIESAKTMLEQGHCKGIDCSKCFLGDIIGHKTRLCQDCFLDSMRLRGSFRIKSLAAKYLADHGEC